MLIEQEPTLFSNTAILKPESENNYFYFFQAINQ